MVTICKRFYSILLTDQNKLSEPLLKIAKITGILGISNLAESPVQELINITQKLWLRKPGQERWDIVDIYKDKWFELLPLFQELKMIQEIKPTKNTYKYALILGGSIQTTLARFDYLKNLLKNNIEIEQLILLTGQRLLNQEEKDKLKELNIKSECKTETDLINALFGKYNIADKFKSVLVVDTPGKVGSSGEYLRPTTGDSIKYWLEKFKPITGSCLAISTQPFIAYQDSVIRTFLPNSFELETVGEKDNLYKSVAVYLDNLARWLYQENERLKLVNRA